MRSSWQPSPAAAFELPRAVDQGKCFLAMASFGRHTATRHSQFCATPHFPIGEQARRLRQSNWLVGGLSVVASKRGSSQNSRGNAKGPGARRAPPLQEGDWEPLLESPPSSGKEQGESRGRDRVSGPRPPPPAVALSPPSLARRVSRQVSRSLASLPLAVGLLLGISALCTLGTLIEQGLRPAAYLVDYPEEHPVLGFLTGRLLLALGLDHIFSTPYFLGLLLLLAASLMACSSTRQWPQLKVARRWSFLRRPETVLQLPVADTLQQARLTDLATVLAGNGKYQVFLQKGAAGEEGRSALYAFKGLVGRLAPIGVHLALLLVMGGGLYTAIGGYRGTSMTPQGLEFFIGDALVPNGVLSWPSASMNLRVHVNNFNIDYRPNGEVNQFFSDLSVLDLQGQELTRKTISVNDPLRCQGVTLYQTDWAISALQVHVDGAPPFNLPMAKLAEPDRDSKLYATFLPLGDEGAERGYGISILARDFQNVVVYDADGNFVGVRRPGSARPISVNGVELVVDEVIGSTGLELKMDPSVPFVYTGFGAFMVTTALSYLSHSQIWAVQVGSVVYVGGRTNRAKLSFEEEVKGLMCQVPEVREGPGAGTLTASDWPTA
eukprot:TRINITY_DN17608_c0_g1_i1.p1 TRINITY_DN17608_c0_g1~~TRINITY_DN17608_c0_g1_i1.p1  ORF type:complete len:607 (+),score=132.82 TRINITY_DN17608_c0_g1_i1:382-2202(+)